MSITLQDYCTHDTYVPQEVVASCLSLAQQKNSDYFSFVRFHTDYVETHLPLFASKPLKAAPIAIKDIILTQ